MSLPPSSAPTATGWSDSCRAGFAPAEEWRLSRRTRSLSLGVLLPAVPRAGCPAGFGSTPSIVTLSPVTGACSASMRAGPLGLPCSRQARPAAPAPRLPRGACRFGCVSRAGLVDACRSVRADAWAPAPRRRRKRTPIDERGARVLLLEPAALTWPFCWSGRSGLVGGPCAGPRSGLGPACGRKRGFFRSMRGILEPFRGYRSLAGFYGIAGQDMPAQRL